MDKPVSGYLIAAADSPDYIVVDADGAAADLLDVPLETVRGASLLTVIASNATLRPLRASLQAAVRTSAACNALIRFVADERLVERRICVVPPPNGEASQLRMTFSAVTPARSADEPAQLDAIVDVISHALRSPLNTTLTWASLLELDPSPATVEKAGAVIRENVKTQARLIDDLVDVSRADTRISASDAASIDVGELLRRTVADARAFLPPNVIVDTAVDRRDHRVPGDPDRLGRVIHHLLRNAANALPDGGTVVATLVTDTDCLTVDVADHGIGMSAAEISQTFRPFWRADRRRSGAGLGLGVVRTIVAQHGGCVCARSTGIGFGSTFTFTLPIRRD